MITLLVVLNAGATVFCLDRTDISNRWNNNPDDRNHYGCKTRLIYFQLLPADSSELEIIGNKKFTILVNNQVVFRDSNIVRWRLDSLKSVYIFPITITCFLRPNGHITSHLIHRATEGHHRFSFLAGNTTSILALSLLWVLAFLIRTNSAVLTEYFNFLKIFAVRYVDEGLLVQRITSFNNIYIFAFCSGLVAINLITFDASTFNIFEDGSWSAWFGISILIGGVFGFLLLKILLINFAARLFKLVEFAPGQFFNFVRILLGCFSISSLVAVAIFIFGGEVQNWRNMFFSLILIFFGLFIITTSLKLINKGGLTVFHLFSYLCVSEIFPMVLLLKIYYF